MQIISQQVTGNKEDMGRRKPVVDWREERRLKVLELLEKGIRPVEVAREVGLSRSAISRIVERSEGREIETKPDTPSVRLVLAVLKKYQWRLKDLAKAVGVSSVTVTQWLEARQIPLPPTLEKLERLLSHGN